MERLTNKRETDAQREGYERRLANGYQRSIPVERIFRLAAYEDTGLTPAEVSAMVKDWSNLCTTIGECGGIDRLRELAEADKDGRLVVLPCKPGDTVYTISWRLSGRHEIEKRVFSLTYFDPAKYGKDYFLSCEEAEKALEAMKDG